MRTFLTSLIAAIGLAGFSLPAAAESAPVPHVVLISIDGLRPDFYLNPGVKKIAPFIHNLAQKGARAKGAVSAYPSTTYPGHANITTGVRPHRHGVTSSGQFLPPEMDGRGFWYQGDLKAPSIWQRAHAAGLSVAAFSWPSSATAPETEWNFPEFWGSMRGTEIRQVLRRATPNILDLADELHGDDWPSILGSSPERDAFLADLAEAVILRHQPNLVLLHFVNTDTVQHNNGPCDPTVRDALKQTDALVKQVHNAVKSAGILDQTVFIITGDHGFTDVIYSFAPNVLLIEHGYLAEDFNPWKAVVEATSGSAAVHLHDPADSKTLKEIQKLFEENSTDDRGHPMFRIVDRKEADSHGAAVKPAFFLEGIPPFMASGAMTGDFVRSARLRGNHGYLPTHPEMHTGLIVNGPGIQSAEIGVIELIDIAPTIAEIMGFEMPDVEGRVLTELLAP